MAALHDPPLRAPELRDLREFRASDLDALLLEESQVWLETLDWDFGNSADLVRRFVDMRGINGAALVDGTGVVGYAYYVYEEHKGLIGDLYVRQPYQCQASEQRLMQAVIEEMVASAQVQRIEAQLMMLSAPLTRTPATARYFRVYPRDFLSIPLPPKSPLAPRQPQPSLVIQTWNAQQQEAAAQLIANAYAGHIDGLINDQYRSLAGARRFLTNIIQYPGCGAFFQPASFGAFHRHTGELCAICLASMVGPNTGHITQICVARRFQGEGLGYELMRRSLEALMVAGCRSVSLTVTSENRQALTLYERLGFRQVRHFSAYVWEGW